MLLVWRSTVDWGASTPVHNIYTVPVYCTPVVHLSSTSVFSSQYESVVCMEYTVQPNLTKRCCWFGGYLQTGVLVHLSTTFVQYRCTVLYTGTVHQHCTPVLYTGTVHRYCTPVLYTRTVHPYCTPVLYTGTVHQHCTPVLFTRTVHW